MCAEIFTQSAKHYVSRHTERLRGAIAEWLKCLTMMLKVAGLSLAQTINWKTLCLPSSEQVLFLGRLIHLEIPKRQIVQT